MFAIRQYWILLSFGALASALSATYIFAGTQTTGWFLETTRSAGFILSNLEIVGAVRTPKRDILANLDIDAGIPLLGIDLAGIQGRIEALPWVKNATVTRVLPGDLHVNIIERVPYALWQHKGKVGLIDEEGVIITRRGLTEFSDLMLIVGESGRIDINNLFQSLEATPGLSSRVKTAVRVGDRRWDLVFDNGVRVKLPEDAAIKYDGNSAWKKFARLQQKHKLLEREVSVIDMRVEDRVVMRVTPAGRRLMNGKEWVT